MTMVRLIFLKIWAYINCNGFIKLKKKNNNNYRNDPKFSDRYAWANSADPDQTAPLGAV